MRRTKRILCTGLGCFVLVAAGLGEAQQRVMPTGTPTILPRKAAATPTPAPLSEAEVEAKRLGLELGTIDAGTWQIVASSWKDETGCLAAVDAHLGETLEELKRLIRTSKVMECAEDADTGRVRLRLTTEEARLAFMQTYGDAASAMRSLRESFADEPAAIEVLESARRRQADWQDRACKELAAERVPRRSAPAAKAPVRTGTKGGSTG